VLTGKRFELTKCALAAEIGADERSGVTIPTGAIIDVIAGPDSDEDHQLISVVWEKRIFAIFATDLSTHQPFFEVAFAESER
jgi:hypothetical protein